MIPAKLSISSALAPVTAWIFFKPCSNFIPVFKASSPSFTNGTVNPRVIVSPTFLVVLPIFVRVFPNSLWCLLIVALVLVNADSASEESTDTLNITLLIIVFPLPNYISSFLH